MSLRTRREFLGEVGRGMLLAGLGTTLAADLGLASADGIESPRALDFGELEPLVALMQETPPGKLNEILVQKLKSGTGLQTLVAAGALANARTFAGQDYIGFHTFMALAPAYRMSQLLPDAQKPLPVLKVLYRNANRIQEFGGRKAELLYELTDEPLPAGVNPAEALRDLSRAGDIDRADRAFGSLASAPIGEAFNHLQMAVEDEVDVHRVVLAWRAYDTLDLAGAKHAHTLLRQSIRYCADVEHKMIQRGQNRSPIREVAPRLLENYGLLNPSLGEKTGDDAWTRELAKVIYGGSREQAAEAAAAALKEGYSADSVAEAMALAANMQVLHDPGRPEKWASDGKPAGSCHGDSIGVHASDAANAWRNIAKASTPRNAAAALVVGAFHTAGSVEYMGDAACPTADQLAAVKSSEAAALLAEAEAAIREKNQFGSVAAIARYGELGFEPRAAFDLMLKYATSEDGALHAEKYFNTASAEFEMMRPSLKWNQLMALSRVTASEFGRPAPGYEEAAKLLGVS